MVDTLVTVPGQQRIPRPMSHRPGAPAPWAGIPADRTRFTRAEIRECLRVLPPGAAPVPRVPGTVAAAVLVPLYEDNGEVHVVLIKRPESMPSHRGEIAFPGGKFEGAVDADLQATALREAHEEVGLNPGAVEIVARLDGIATVASRFSITPFVGFLPGPPKLTPNPREVTRVLLVPLSDLLADGVYREERWETTFEDMSVYFFELADETVWGATARILTKFLAHLTKR
jgi:8-oxo-dGTP pyrophosphatase MutT (NUDIX family)